MCTYINSLMLVATKLIYNTTNNAMCTYTHYYVLHDEVVATVAKLFRTLRLDAIVEPTRLFNNPDEDASSQRPDIFIRSPRGLGRQAIIE